MCLISPLKRLADLDVDEKNFRALSNLELGLLKSLFEILRPEIELSLGGFEIMETSVSRYCGECPKFYQNKLTELPAYCFDQPK
jgi:hypothetical protein